MPFGRLSYLQHLFAGAGVASDQSHATKTSEKCPGDCFAPWHIDASDRRYLKEHSLPGPDTGRV